MQVEIVPIDSVHLDPANARLHSERNMRAIEASLVRFGPQMPLAVVDKSGVVRVGNARIAAARNLGWDEVPIIRTELTSGDAIAYAIADNRTSELAEWDDDILAAQLQGLLTEDEALLDAAGFDEDELAKMLDEFDADEVLPPGLADGDREPFRQMTFTVHDSQHEVIEAALKTAKANGGGESVVNENSNGNALAFICGAFNG
jgi:ParB-like chromosome segregation protein Spo0J